MPLRFFRTVTDQVKSTLSRVTCNTQLYAWSLGGSVPDKLLFSPRDLWQGDAEKGRWLTQNGIFTLGGDQLELHNANWRPGDASEMWLSHLHGFDWLRDLRALGGDPGRMASRAMIENWIMSCGGWHDLTWRGDILGRRVANWLAGYDFFGESASDEFQDLFFCALMRQIRHLHRSLPGALSGLPLLYAIKGLTYGGLAVEGQEAALETALTLLEKEIDKQILRDGGHISRRPQALLETVQILIDIRAALQQGGYPPIEKIQHALDRAVPAIRFFRHGDRHFSLFHGTQMGDEALMKQIFLQSGSRAKSLSCLPQTGFERIAQGKALLIVDAGKSAPYPHDTHAHAAPLAFEYSVGRERIFVNCGSHPTCDIWQDSLRNTAAHNTLSIDNRNACEVLQDRSLGRKPRTVLSTREEKEGHCLLELCHDGYVPINGITHRRRLYVSDQGSDFRGEETLSAKNNLNPQHQIDVRFHLHPSVMVSLVQEGTQALLRLGSGMGWRFSMSGGQLSLENSIYLAEGITPRKTKQLVISSPMESNFLQMKWALQKETG